MRARRGLRVILDGKDRIFSVDHPFNGPVIEIYVADVAFGLNRSRVDREVVILRRYLHVAGLDPPYRMIGPMMAERQLESLSTKGQT